jgi:hypothetical protein
MTIKRYFVTRGTGSNMGQADVLEIFSIYGQATTSSSEASRVLLQFDTTKVKTDRDNGVIPGSGDVKFFLNMFNTPHAETLPVNFTLTISAVSQSWEEGYGLDMETYSDLTYDSTGSNWIKRGTLGSWSTPGGDYHASPTFEQTFTEGYENLSVDVTTLVEQWVATTKQNYGFGIQLSSSQESANRSFFTKKFFARSSEFFFDRPVLEARWESSIKDNRGCFYASSSLASATDNLQNLYLYNKIRGRLKNIPAVGTNSILVDLYESAGGAKIGTSFTGSHVSTGIYKCQVYADTTDTLIVDVWNSSSVEYHTGSITVKPLEAEVSSQSGKYVLKISDAKNYYKNDGFERFRLYTRLRNWSPNIYTTSKSIPETTIIYSASYEVFRIIDNKIVVPHGTGSTLHTLMSYDVDGNYFDLDMDILEAGYDYGIRFSFYDDYTTSWKDQSYEFRFKVRKNEY